MPISMLLAMALGQAPAPSGAQTPPRRPPVDRQERFDRMFARADTNGDGQLSRAELQAARERMRERRMERREARGEGGGPGWRGPAHQGGTGPGGRDRPPR